MSEFGKVFTLCCLAFFGIYYIVDIFNRIEIFITYKAALGYKFGYFLYKLPQIIYQVVPVALLITVVTVLSLMARNNERTAIRAGGVNLYAFTFPLVMLSALVSLLIFVSNEYLLPFTNQQASRILDEKIKGKPPRGIFRQSRIWYMGKDNAVWNVETLDPQRGVLEGVTLLRFDQDFHPVERIDAVTAMPGRGGWIFVNAVRRVFADRDSRLREVTREETLFLPVTEKLEDFFKYKKDPDEMNYRELRLYVERLQSSGFNAVPYRVDLLAKTAIPLISLVVAFLAISLAIRANPRGGIMASVGLCLTMGLAYWLVLSIGLSLGHAGRLYPLMAAWGANIIFGFFGLYLYANLRQ